MAGKKTTRKKIIRRDKSGKELPFSAATRLREGIRGAKEAIRKKAKKKVKRAQKNTFGQVRKRREKKAGL
jgi:hypothetical protein